MNSHDDLGGENSVQQSEPLLEDFQFSAYQRPRIERKLSLPQIKKNIHKGKYLEFNTICVCVCVIIFIYNYFLFRTILFQANTLIQITLAAASLAAPVFCFVDHLYLHILW